jgi:hypothetical protein
MTSRQELIAQLRLRPDLGVKEDESAWQILITQGRQLCEITIPKQALEWFACVKGADKKELWSDWMDYYDKPFSELEDQMAQDILAFANRASIFPFKLPLKIWENPSEASV